jgi:hypothetical protein
MIPHGSTPSNGIIVSLSSYFLASLKSLKLLISWIHRGAGGGGVKLERKQRGKSEFFRGQ